MGRKGLIVVAGILVFSCVAFIGCEKLKKAAAPAAKKDVAASVGDKVITLKEVDDRIAKLPAYYQTMLKGRKKEILEDMVLEILLFDEAKRLGLENNTEVKEMLEEAKKKIVISKLIKDEVETRAAVSDKEVEDYYTAHKEEFVTPERWKASHILLKTEEEARAVSEALSKGKAFEDLAKEKSQDTSAKQGGDIGYFTKGQLVPEFEEAASKLAIGQLSGIVKSQFGYHIIKLTDKKPAEAQELKEVLFKIKNQLLMNKKQEAFNKLTQDLRAKAKVVINESLLEEKKEEPLQPPLPPETGTK